MFRCQTHLNIFNPSRFKSTVRLEAPKHSSFEMLCVPTCSFGTQRVYKENIGERCAMSASLCGRAYRKRDDSSNIQSAQESAFLSHLVTLEMDFPHESPMISP